jgi:hypothetical protein
MSSQQIREMVFWILADGNFQNWLSIRVCFRGRFWDDGVSTSFFI